MSVTMDVVDRGFEDEFSESKRNQLYCTRVIALTAMVNRCRKDMVYFGVDDSGNVIGIKPGSDT